MPEYYVEELHGLMNQYAQKFHKISEVQTRWEADFDHVAGKIPAEWLVDTGDYVGIKTEYVDTELVRLYQKLVTIGYAKGWL